MGKQSLGGSFTGDPVVGVHPDGHLETWLVGFDGDLYRKHQTDANVPGSFVDSWTAYPRDRNEPFDPLTALPSFTTDEYGASWIFVRSVRGRILYSKTGPGFPWTDWRSLSTVQDGHPAMGNVVAVRFRRGGGPWLFARGVRNNLLFKNLANDDWEDGARWQSLGGVLASDPRVVGQNAEGRLQFFITVVGTDGNPWRLVSRGASPADIEVGWHSLVCTSSPNDPQFTGAKPAGIPLHRDPNLGVIWPGIDGRLWNRLEDPSGFARLGGCWVSPDVTISSDVCVLTPPGREYQFFRSANGELAMARFVNGQWQTPPLLIDLMLGTPAAAIDPAGRVHVFYRTLDRGQLTHLWEETPGGFFVP
jgi:hypothetical protein